MARLQHNRLAAILISYLLLTACTPLDAIKTAAGLATSGGPSLEANTQTGGERVQGLSVKDEIATDIESGDNSQNSVTQARTATTVTGTVENIINHSGIESWRYDLLMWIAIIGWLLPTPQTILGRVWRWIKKPRGQQAWQKIQPAS